MNKATEWDKISNNYLNEREKKSIPYYVSDDTIIGLVKETDINILDYGAGIGTLSKRISNKHNNIYTNVYAYEPIQDMINAYKKVEDKNKYPNINLITNLENINNINFDLIICNNVLDHIENMEEVILYFYSKLKIGGNLIISIPHPFKNSGIWKKELNNGEYIYTDFLVSNYMNENKSIRNREDINGSVVVNSVISNNRKLETYFNLLSNYGFHIKNIYEPGPNNICKIEAPIVYSKTSRLPYFLIFYCTKK